MQTSVWLVCILWLSCPMELTKSFGSRSLKKATGKRQLNWEGDWMNILSPAIKLTNQTGCFYVKL